MDYPIVYTGANEVNIFEWLFTQVQMLRTQLLNMSMPVANSIAIPSRLWQDVKLSLAVSLTVNLGQ